MGFFAEYAMVNRLLKTEQGIVFYAESRHYFQYYQQLIEDLSSAGQKILYITSDKKDPLLQAAPSSMEVVYSKWMLAFLLKKIRAKVMIMTMPDLNNYLFKRSPEVGSYVYVFHAAVSTHQQYRRHAFDHYDEIFCTGEYQVKEIQAAEKLNGSRSKILIPYGYPLFNELKGKTISRPDEPSILIAPSWFEGCIFDTCIEELLKQLSSMPYRIILRSHPEYEKRKKKKFQRIKTLLATYNGLLDEEPNVLKSLQAADILITDRSGIAFEFAFGVQRPVLFIDTIPKETNPDWKKINIEPIEDRLRDQIGISIVPNNLDLLQEKLTLLGERRNGFKEKMADLEQQHFFDHEKCRQPVLKFLLKKL